MKKHYNLYYIFLEDKLKNPMSEERRREMEKNILKILKKIKPIHPSIPP